MGSWPWCFALAYVGARLGQGWDTDPRFKAVFHRFHVAVELILIAGIVYFHYTHLQGRRTVTAA